MKASDNLRQYELAQDEAFSFPINVKDYLAWKDAVLPVYFILYDAQLSQAYWLDMHDHVTAQPDPKGKIVRLRIPRQHVLGVQTLRLIRQRKQHRVEEIRKHIRKGT